MNDINEAKLYERAVRVWGKEPQMLQVIEEMSELTKEILKNVNRKKDNIAEIIEEAADVEIMLGQLKCCYKIEKQVADYKAEKLKTIVKRLDEWEKKEK
ncbi:MAG: hypothetical protein J6039_02320 [Alphaproteobacteria bacterium]|jgi:hypothetical protein|nr:hypothetical protein [Alphaproteobacteria bacterium]